MSANHESGPAFPTENAHQSGASTWHYEGMTLCDYFAAKAMHAVLTGAEGMGSLSDVERKEAWRTVGLMSYEIADAMLAARAALKADSQGGE